MGRKRKDARKPAAGQTASAAQEAASAPRIIGGSLGGRKLLYAGPQPRTRPMKERVREAVFNLVGTDAVNRHAIDLFAGTGALAFEALSRGAARATIIEQHFPTADLIRRNAVELDVADRIDVVAGNCFLWAQRLTASDNLPWLVFCSPPFAFYQERREAMLSLLSDLAERAPAGSVLVVEADQAFDMGDLPDAERWDVRHYPPAVVAIYRK